MQSVNFLKIKRAILLSSDEAKYEVAAVESPVKCLRFVNILHEL